MRYSWFRLYSEFATDPKVQSMSEDMQRRLVMIFCLKCNDDLHKLSEEEIACYLRIPQNEFLNTKALFTSKGFIDEEWNILNWEKRQFTAQRKQQDRHREKRESLGLPRRRWINPQVREFVLARDKQACAYCASEHNLTLDHIVPEIKGGDNTADNLVVSCRSCNSKKREFTLDQAGMRFREDYSPPPGSTNNKHNKQGPSKGLASTDTDTDIGIAKSDDFDSRRKQPKKKRGLVPVHPEIFDEFWKTYPRKTAKQEAIKAWNSINQEDEMNAILVPANGIEPIIIAKIRENIDHNPQWHREDGQFIPHPATWLRQRRWLDELPKNILQGKLTQKGIKNLHVAESWLKGRENEGQ